MITQITGEIVNINQNNKSLVLLNNGIGFELVSNMRILAGLKRNQQVTLHVFTQFREDGFHLYAFSNQAERELFEKVIKISGIGPKAALNILEALNVNDFISAVIKEDHKLIATAQGVGKKTAERIVLELKSSFKGLNAACSVNEDDFINKEEVYSVLSSLGFSALDINEKLKLARSKDEADDVESLVRFCLAN